MSGAAFEAAAHGRPLRVSRQLRTGGFRRRRAPGYPRAPTYWLLAGSLEGQVASTRTFSDLFYADLQLEAGASYRLLGSISNVRFMWSLAKSRWSRWWGRWAVSVAINWCSCARAATSLSARSKALGWYCSVASRLRGRAISTGTSSPAAGRSASFRPLRLAHAPFSQDAR